MEVSSHIDEDSLRRGEFDSYTSNSQESSQSSSIVRMYSFINKIDSSDRRKEKVQFQT